MGDWIDISQPINNQLAHWPNTQPFHYSTTITKKETGSVNIGEIITNTHVGTHVDAPYHFQENGLKILDLDINHFIGMSRIIDLSKSREISAESLKEKLTYPVERLLIKTSLSNNPEVFPKDVTPITASGAEYLHSLGVKVVGIDTPSVDPLNSKELVGHHSLCHYGIYILENVMLDHVAEGNYELIAIPLPLQDADGSLVRAVIRPMKEQDTI